MYMTATIDPAQRHLIAVSIGSEIDPGDICEFSEFVIANIDDAGMIAECITNLNEHDLYVTNTGIYIRPVWQSHIIE